MNINDCAPFIVVIIFLLILPLLIADDQAKAVSCKI